jgi:photosystem II stability/assembly factor-like uncharacterized protein
MAASSPQVVYPVVDEMRTAHPFSSTSGWVLTAHRVLTTADSGSTWTNVTPPSSDNSPIETAFFLNPSQAWAVVRSADVNFAECGLTPLDLFTSSDGGRHWNRHRMTPTTQCDTAGPVYLTFVDPMRGWMVVDQGSHSGFMHYAGFQTFDGGLTWTPLSYPQSGPLLFINQLDGFSVGGGDGPQSGAYGTHDGGRTWGRLALAPPRGSTLSSTFTLPVFSDSHNGVLGGDILDPSGGTASVVFYTTSDAGRSWRLAAKVANPHPMSSAQAAGVVSATTWLAEFPAPGPGPSYTVLNATHDGGHTWEWTTATQAGWFFSPISFAGSTGWGIVTDSGCRGFKTDCFTNWSVLQTLDAGSHWSRLPVT